MGYGLHRDERIAVGIQRAALGEIESALAILTAIDDHGVDRGVHAVRKHTKRTRSALRLLDDAKTSKRVRDAARLLATHRDRTVIVATAAPWTDLGDPTEIDRSTFRAAADHLEAAAARLHAKAPSGGRRTSTAGRLGHTYRRGQKRFPAVNRPTDAAWHSWRKEVKHLAAQLRLFAPAAPSILWPQIAQLDLLADTLGTDHDLAITRPHLGSISQIELDEERQHLQSLARGWGARLYAEDPDGLSRRVQGYLSAWRHHGDEPPRPTTERDGLLHTCSLCHLAHHGRLHREK